MHNANFVLCASQFMNIKS